MNTATYITKRGIARVNDVLAQMHPETNARVQESSLDLTWVTVKMPAQVGEVVDTLRQWFPEINFVITAEGCDA